VPAVRIAEKLDRPVGGIVLKAQLLGLSLRTAAAIGENRPSIQGQPVLNGNYEARVTFAVESANPESAPRWPHTLEMKRGSRSDRRTLSPQ